MIVEIKPQILPDGLKQLEMWLSEKGAEFHPFSLSGRTGFVTTSKWNGDLDTLRQLPYVSNIIDCGTEHQLSSRKFKSDTTTVEIGDEIVFGANQTVLMSGPCAVESEEQVMRTAKFIKE
ncbi:MAG: hypothetical protein KDD42_08720, partial [Bdellovibrionales bacterium]|nr:hypothetical protein [Bdellovibrionales bacterium]